MALPPEELQKVDPAVFAEAQVLSNAEVGIMLNHYSEQKRAENQNWMPSKVVQQTIDYSRATAKDSNEEQLKSLRIVLEHAGLYPYEFGVIANAQPANSEEAFTLVPSLKEKFTEEEMEAVLTDAALYQTF